PHKHVCWLSDRPILLKHNANGQLHNASGPALQYAASPEADGWSYYAWKGVRIPPWLIEKPETITLKAIAAAHSVRLRRCMIDILTPARFVAMGGAKRVREDATGVLWRATWRHGDAWAAVEVVNGTPGPDGSYKRFFLQVPAHLSSPRSAVAWTYGLQER